MCGKSPESVPHVLAGVGQTKFISWGATQLLQILFLEMLKDL